ncbi:MAG: rhomboid family intramembrane serine protease [Bacteroidales bacterium]
MIPIRDVIPSRTVPIVTIALIVANSFVYLYEWMLWAADERLLQAFIFHYGLVPVRFRWSAAFTSMFLHANLIHVLGNMWFLWIFGDNVEDRLGHGRFIAFYLLCGLVGAAVQTVTTPYSFIPTIGASGAIAGVMGGYLVLYPHSRVLTIIPPFIFWVVEIPAVFFLGYWFVLQLFNGFGTIAVSTSTTAGGVAFWAHIAGFVAGASMVFVFRRPERQRVEWWD